MSERAACECGAIGVGRSRPEKRGSRGLCGLRRVPRFVSAFGCYLDPAGVLQILLGLGRAEQPQAEQDFGAQLGILLLSGDADQVVFRAGVEQPEDDWPLVVGARARRACAAVRRRRPGRG